MLKTGLNENHNCIKTIVTNTSNMVVQLNNNVGLPCFHVMQMEIMRCALIWAARLLEAN